MGLQSIDPSSILGTTIMTLLNTKKKGELTEIQIASEFLKREIPVLFPFGDSHPYDLVIDYNDNFIRIQCKTSRLRKDCINFNTTLICHNRNENYSVDYENKIDFFATIFDNEVYLIHVNETSKGKQSLRIKNYKNGNKRTKFAKDYHIDKVLRNIKGM